MEPIGELAGLRAKIAVAVASRQRGGVEENSAGARGHKLILREMPSGTHYSRTDICEPPYDSHWRTGVGANARSVSRPSLRRGAIAIFDRTSPETFLDAAAFTLESVGPNTLLLARREHAVTIRLD